MGVTYATYATPRMDLGQALMEFDASGQGFIGTQLFPIFKTQKKAATYSAITRESLLLTSDARRAAGSGYNRRGIGGKDKTYSCQEFGLEIPLDDGQRELYATDFDFEMVSAQILQGDLLRNQEKRVADIVFNLSTFTGSALYNDVSSNPWSTVGTDIIGQIQTAIAQVRTNCGMTPDTLTVSWRTWTNLKANTGVRTAIQYVSALTDAQVSGMLASVLGINRILVGNSIYNSAKEGQTFTGANYWSNLYAHLAVTAKNANSLADPAIGRTFLWVADSPENVTAETYREEGVRSEILRVRQQVDEELIDPYFGHLLKVNTA